MLCFDCMLQHFPMYRQSDKNCTGPDAAPMEERNGPWKEKFDTLSKSASKQVKIMHVLIFSSENKTS